MVLVFPLFLVLTTICLTTSLKCYDSGYFEANSTFSENRDLVLSSLASKVIEEGGFYNTTFGQDSDTVYALALCRVGYDTETCSKCITTSTRALVSNCPNETEAFSWGGNVPCLASYSNRSVFGLMELHPFEAGYNDKDIKSNLTEFGQIWDDVMVRAVKRVSFRLDYYAAETEMVTGFETIYVLMQCRPDLLASDCNYCLRESVDYYRGSCLGKQGGYVVRPSCFFRWDLYSFYGAFDETQLVPRPQPLSPPLPPPGLQNKNYNLTHQGKYSSKTVIIILIPTVVGLLALAALAYAIVRKKGKKTENTPDNYSLRYDLRAIKTATNNFSSENMLGQGGFGHVYKGKLSDGQDIAVKRMCSESIQGETEFKNEIVLIGRIHHRNLVRPLGFCMEKNEKLLIYEFVSNSSLNHYLTPAVVNLPEHSRFPTLDWNTRYNIIGGIARGLLYLHEDSQFRIIHRDLKASNVLLDANMNPKISDFGTARCCPVDDETHHNTERIVVDMSPEYIRDGQFSVKTDVYSFGVLVLEIVSGQRTSSFQIDQEPQCLLAYSWKYWNEARALELVDLVIRDGSRSEITWCIHIRLLCIQENVTLRPTMSSVVLWLNTSLISLSVPSTPSYLVDNTPTNADMSSSIQLNSHQRNDAEAGTSSVNDIVKKLQTSKSQHQTKKN